VSRDKFCTPSSQRATDSGLPPWKYTSVRLHVDRIAASLTRRAPVRSRSASVSASGVNATRSRTSSGAVVWFSPSV
jgi:hypothetical protein